MRTLLGENLAKKRTIFTFQDIGEDPYIKDQNGVFQFNAWIIRYPFNVQTHHKDETLDIHTTDAQGWKDEISIDELAQVFLLQCRTDIKT